MMEGFIIFILVIVVVIFLIRAMIKGQDGGTTINMLHDLLRETHELKKEVRILKNQLQDSTSELKQQIENLPTVQLSHSQADDKPLTREVLQQPEAEIVKPVVVYEPPVFTPETVEIPAEQEALEPVLAEVHDQMMANFDTVSAAPNVAVEQEIPIAATVNDPTPQSIYEDTESGYDKWLRNNPDLEKFIGENLINKIGIAILVLGIAFFVKYAIDKEWINEVGRVCIGMGCGAILVGLAHFMRNTYRSFSSVLAGGGIAVFYFTIAFAFHQYHLMPQAVAFVIMVVITAFAIALSVLYDKLELAVIATVGGFLAPFMVSTGEGNYIVLFTYLIILDLGILSLAYFKRWPAINIIALCFTEIIFGGWLSTVLNNPAKHYSFPVALLFATAFYFIFLGMNMINQMKNRDHFKPFDFMILLFISSTYYGAGMLLLHYWNAGMYQGVFTLCMGLVNLALTYYVYKNGKADRNLLFLLIGITLTFITLTIPIQLHGHAITMFWSAEFVLLYWLSEYSGIRLFKYSSSLLCVLTVISLFMDWDKAGNNNGPGLHLIFNSMQGIVTNLVAAGAFTGLYFLLRKDREGEIAGVSNILLGRLSLTAAIIILYLTCIFGVNFYFHQLISYTIPNVYHRMVTEVFALIFMILIQRWKGSVSPWLSQVALAICFVFLVASSGYVLELRNSVLAGSTTWAHFYMHWLDSLLMGLMIWLAIQSVRSEQDALRDSLKAISILMTILVICFFSMEFVHIYVMAGYHKDNTALLESQYGKAGLTVIWALSSFALMWLGMQHGQKTLRIISLALFSIVLLKLFVFDISGISEGGKILAFILLGVLLLTVSFMYQKLKKIIIDDKKE